MNRYSDNPKAPVCFHVLGQDLVNALHAECRELRQQRDLMLAGLKQCKAAVEDTKRLPSARMELVRDYATPLIVAAQEWRKPSKERAWWFDEMRRAAR